MPDEIVMVEEDGTEKEEGEKREIGKLAVWTVSSNKPGNGVEMLRDNNLTTYWQYNNLALLFLCNASVVYKPLRYAACSGNMFNSIIWRMTSSCTLSVSSGIVRSRYCLRHCEHFNICRSVLSLLDLCRTVERSLGTRAKSVNIKFLSLCMNSCNFKVGYCRPLLKG